MIMRLPDSGSWLSAALNSLGHPVGVPTESTSVADVSDAQLIEVAGGVDGKTMRQRLLAYRGGDTSWRTSQTWTDA